MSVIIKKTTPSKTGAVAVKKKPGFLENILHKADSILKSGPQIGPTGPRGTTSPKSVMTIKKKTK
jgi:hypothetical protein